MSVVKPKVRQWQAAETSKFLENWPTAGRPPDIDIRYGLAALRARARLDAQNVDHIRGFLNIVVSNVVGRAGVQLQAKPRLNNGKTDKKLEQLIEENWAAWGKRGVCDVTGQFSWAMLQRQAIRSCARDGEAIFRLYEGFSNDYQFAVQEIDADCLDLTVNQSRERNRPEIRMGIEYDQWRRPVAYYLTEEPAINQSGYTRKSDHERVPAEQILHLYLPEWTWQSRGVPWMSSSLTRLHVLAAYEDAEVAAAAVSARKLGFYKLNPEAPQEIADQAQPQTHDIGVAEFEELPPYYDFVGWDPQHPSTAYADFVKACLRSVATGLGVSYNTLANDLEGVNYSSLRQGAIQERELWMNLQDWFSECFCQPIYDRWMRQALDGATGMLDGVPERKRMEAKRVSWQPRRWQWVDPMKDAEANRVAVEMGTRSISDIIREQGRDPEQVWQELSEDLQRLNELGITVNASATNTDTGSNNGPITTD